MRSKMQMEMLVGDQRAKKVLADDIMIPMDEEPVDTFEWMSIFSRFYANGDAFDFTSARSGSNEGLVLQEDRRRPSVSALTSTQRQYLKHRCHSTNRKGANFTTHGTSEISKGCSLFQLPSEITC